MSLSVVVPVLRGRDTVLKLVESLASNIPEELFRSVQLVLVGESPRRLTSTNPALSIVEQAVVEKHPGIRRNVGFSIASQEVVALLDDDVLVTRSWFEAIYEEYHRAGYQGLLTGPSELPYGNDLSEMMSSSLTNQFLSPFRPSHRTHVKKVVNYRNAEFCNCVLTKTIWKALGRFDEVADYRIDDTLFCCKAMVAGFPIMNHPGLQVAHRRSKFPVKYYGWVFSEKFHQAKLHVHYPFVFRADWYFMIPFCLLLAALILTGLFSFRWVIPILLVYLTLSYAFSMKAMRPMPRIVILLTPLFLLGSYCVMFTSLCLGMIFGFWTRKATGRTISTVKSEIAKVS